MNAGAARLLCVVPSLGSGGAELHLVRVLNHLDPARYAAQVAVARGGGAYESLLDAGIARHVLVGGALWSATGRMVRAVGPLRRLIERERPDLVFALLPHANAAAAVAVGRASPRPRLVLGVQNPTLLDAGWLPVVARAARRTLVRRWYPCADGIIALTQGVAGELVEVVPAVAGLVTVIPNAGVDERVRQAAREPLAEGARSAGVPLIVACGRLVEQKGFALLLRAFAELRRRVPAVLWIIGEGPERPALEALGRRLGVAGDVRLLGWRDNPYPYIAAADVFALSSLWEGFGNVIVEAMACGTPVVATDCPFGPREIIRHGESGWLVPPGDPAALAGGMRMVLENEGLRAALAAGGRRRAGDFDARTVAARHADYFDRVLLGALAPAAGEAR